MLPNPKTRKELYLSLIIDAISGEPITLPNPQTTEELMYDEIITAIQTHLATGG